MEFATVSGRIYRVRDIPNVPEEVRFAWGTLCRVNAVSNRRDVTQEYLSAMRAYLTWSPRLQ